MNAHGGFFEARLAQWSTPRGRDESLRVRTYSTGQAKEGASADSAEEMKDTTGVSPWRLHFLRHLSSPPVGKSSADFIDKIFDTLFDLVIYHTCGLRGHTHSVGDVPENDLFAFHQVFWPTVF